jgi:TRAP-type C4-dicarboxylate transport system permease small subunit
MDGLRKISRGFDKFLSWMDGIASLSIAAIMVLITADVLSRLVLNKPFVGTAEIVSSLIIIVCFLEIPYVSMRKGHVRTTVLYDRVGRKGKDIIDIIACTLGIFAYGLIIKASFPGLLYAIDINEAEIAGSFRFTTIPGRFAIIFGSVLMVLEFMNQLIKYTYDLITGKSIEDKGEIK